MSGDAAFKLYDTYGFARSDPRCVAREGREVDTDGFDAAMEEQKAKARAAWAGSGEAADTVWFDVLDTAARRISLVMTPRRLRGRLLRWKRRQCR